MSQMPHFVVFAIHLFTFAIPIAFAVREFWTHFQEEITTSAIEGDRTNRLKRPRYEQVASESQQCDHRTVAKCPLVEEHDTTLNQNWALSSFQACPNVLGASEYWGQGHGIGANVLDDLVAASERKRNEPWLDPDASSGIHPPSRPSVFHHIGHLSHCGIDQLNTENQVEAQLTTAKNTLLVFPIMASAANDHFLTMQTQQALGHPQQKLYSNDIPTFSELLARPSSGGLNPENFEQGGRRRIDEKTMIGTLDGSQSSLTHQHADSIHNREILQLSRDSEHSLETLLLNSGEIDTTCFQAFPVMLDPPDFMLEAFYFPKNTVSNNLLRNCLMPYNRKIREISFDRVDMRRQGTNKHFFTGLPVCILKTRSIAKLTDLSIIRLMKTPDEYLKPFEMTPLISSLIRWLIFIYAAFMQQRGILEEEKHDAQVALLSWIWNEMFSPKDSLPVIGEVNSNIIPGTTSVFGPTQRLLIHYLLKRTSRSAFRTSIRLIGYWYKKLDSEAWRTLFGKKNEFCLFMKQAVESTKHKSIPLGFPDKQLPKEWTWVGNFQIVANPRSDYHVSSSTDKILDSTLAHLMGQYPTLVKYEDDIMEKLRRVHEALFHSQRDHKRDFDELLLGVSAFKLNDKPTTSFVRLLTEANEVIHTVRVTKKVQRMVKCLRFYLTLLFTFPESQGKEMIIKSPEEFFNWLSIELFTPENSLPVFGELPNEIESLNKDQFGEVQQFIIQHLTRRHLVSKMDEAWLTLIGFWFKNECILAWDTHFIDDAGYWAYVDKVLHGGQ